MAATSAEDWSRATVVPAEGEGTLARVGPVLLLVASDQAETVKPYLEHVQMVAANGGQGRQLVRGFAMMLSTTVDQSPGFAALAPHTTGLAVFVDGDVSVSINGQVITGADSLAWVEKLIPWPVESVTVTLPGAAAPAATSTYRLDGGVIPAGSFSISGAADDAMMSMTAVRPAAGEAPATNDSMPAVDADVEMTDEVDVAAAAAPAPAQPAPAAEAPAPTPPTPGRPLPAAPADEHVSFQSVLLDEVDVAAAAAPEAPAQPAPAAEAPAPTPPTPGRPLPAAPADEHVSFQSVLLDEVEDDPDFEPLPIVDAADQVQQDSPKQEVRGVYCKNRHFNDPRVLFCSVCGINMVQQTPVLVTGTRPPLGVIVLDDGSVFQLDNPYLLGRDPSNDERITAGEFRPLPIIDQSNQVSRVHARLEMRGWDVVLVDNNSTNGTFVHVPKTPDWVRMPSGTEQVLVQGTRIRIGHRTLAFNTHAGDSR